ncbi:MAG: protein kinase [Planctomycetaceae bacterium]|nr:protein kinase [Planctomycetaceae bacterium]
MNSDDNNPIDLLAEDFVARYRLGERPALTEYVLRHPELEKEIRSLFPALVMLEQARSQGDDSDVRSRLVPLETSAAPEQLGEFRILREVGRGGMGIVYEAIQESLGRHVALKILPHQSMQNPKHLQRFQREVRAAAKLQHPNIVPVFGAGEIESVHFYAMQFIQGLALDQVANEVRRLRSEKMSKTNRGDKGPEPAQESGEENPQKSAGRNTSPRRDSAACLATCLVSGVFVRPESPESSNAADPVVTPSRAVESAEPGDSGKPESAASSGSTGGAATGATDSRISSTVQGGGLAYWHSVARIGIQVAEALQYAADQGVLHRDIKPANLLLDLKGNVWVTDFGLAKSDDSDELTNPGDIVGTLRYLAPERLKGISDLSSDIYSLGATLYELLVLRPLFDGVRREQLLNVISEVDPIRPRLIDASIPADLETVVLKAISKDALDRYSSASELAGDLRRFLEDRPVHARRARPSERLWRWCRRNRALAILMSTLSILAVVLFVGGWIANAVRTERDEAIHQYGLAVKAGRENELLLERAQAAEKESRIREHLANALYIQQSGQEGQRLNSLREIAMAAAMQPSAVLRDQLTDAAVTAVQLTDLKVESRFALPLTGPGVFNPAGTLFVQVQSSLLGSNSQVPSHPVLYKPDGDFSLQIRRTDDWQAITRLPSPAFPCTSAVPEFSATGAFLFVTYFRAGEPPVLVCRESETWKVVHTVSIQASPARTLRHHHSNGHVIVYQDLEDHLVIWDLLDGRETARIRLSWKPGDFCFNEDGEKLLVIHHRPAGETSATTVDIKTGGEDRLVMPLESGEPVRLSIAFSSHAQRLAFGRTDGSIELWDVKHHRLLVRTPRHPGRILNCEFSPDGNWLFSNSIDGTSRIWETSSGRPVLLTSKRILGFTDDGRVTFANGESEKFEVGIGRLLHEDHVRKFDELPLHPSIASSNQIIESVVFSPDEKLMVTCHTDGIVFWDVSSGRRLHHLRLNEVIGLRFSKDGGSFITLHSSEAYRWPVSKTSTGSSLTFQCGPPAKIDAAPESEITRPEWWFHDGQTRVSFDIVTREIRVRDAGSGAASATVNLLIPGNSRVDDLAMSSSGEWLAASCAGQRAIFVWNARTQQRIEVFPRSVNETPMYRFGFSADDRWLVVSEGFETLSEGYWIIDTETWRPAKFLPGKVVSRRPALFKGSNFMVATVAANDLRIVDIETARTLARLPCTEQPAGTPVAVIGSDSVVATLSDSRQSVFLWNLASISNTLKSIGLGWELSVDEPQSTPLMSVSSLVLDDGGLVERDALRFRNRRGVLIASEYARQQLFDEAVSRIDALVSLDDIPEGDLDRLAWQFVKRADCSNAEATCAVRLASRALELSPMNADLQNTLGVALFREGSFRDAIEPLTKSMSLAPASHQIDNSLFVAMCYWQLGDRITARKWMSDAITAYDNQPSHSEELQQFRREAEALVTLE